MLAERGLEGLTVAAVAERAGVAKATIYRRWPSKEDLFGALVRARADELPASDTGSVRQDLVQYLSALIKLLTTPPAPAVLKAIVAAMARNEPLRQVVQGVIARRRAVTRAMLERGVRRGELRTDIDYELALDMLVGPSYFRLLLSGDPIPQDYAERVVDAMLAGFARR